MAIATLPPPHEHREKYSMESIVQNSNGNLFHYTDISAVKSILQNKELWLTHMEFMNDRDELQSGINQILEWVNNLDLIGFSKPHQTQAFEFLKSSYEGHANFGYAEFPLFSCSFSRADNLLSQWRAYGSFAIEFYREGLENDFNLVDCIYEKKEKLCAVDELARNVLESISSDIINEGEIGLPGHFEYSKLVTEASKFKNEHFAEEQEVRIVSPKSIKSGEVQFRSKSGILIPYLIKKFDITAIKSIHIGPSVDQELAEKSLRALLMSLELERISIHKSNIPYRS